MKPEKHKHTYGKLRRILRFLRPYLFLEFAIFVFMIIVVALSLLDPLVLMYFLDHILIEGELQNLKLLNIAILALIGLFVVRAFLNVINNYLYIFIGQRILFDIRLKLFRHLEKLHLDFLDFLVLVFYFNSSFFDRFSTAKLRYSDLPLSPS